MSSQSIDQQTMHIVLVHGAWADGSGWAKVIAPLVAEGFAVTAAPLPTTSYTDDVKAIEQALDRVAGPAVPAGHAYAGAVIAGVRNENVKALVYVSALAPDEGETVADVFYRTELDPRAPQLAPNENGLIYYPQEAFATAYAQNATNEELVVLAAVQRPFAVDHTPMVTAPETVLQVIREAAATVAAA